MANRSRPRNLHRHLHARYPDRLTGSKTEAPRRSSIERRILHALKARFHLDMTIPWVRAHIGISGNEEGHVRTDTRTDSRSPYIATEGGVRAESKGRREEGCQSPSHGVRTDYGPMNGWLHYIKKGGLPHMPPQSISQGRRHSYHIPLPQIPHRVGKLISLATK